MSGAAAQQRPQRVDVGGGRRRPAAGALGGRPPPRAGLHDTAEQVDEHRPALGGDDDVRARDVAVGQPGLVQTGQGLLFIKRFITDI